MRCNCKWCLTTSNLVDPYLDGLPKEGFEVSCLQYLRRHGLQVEKSLLEKDSFIGGLRSVKNGPVTVYEQGFVILKTDSGYTSSRTGPGNHVMEKDAKTLLEAVKNVVILYRK